MLSIWSPNLWKPWGEVSYCQMSKCTNLFFPRPSKLLGLYPNTTGSRRTLTGFSCICFWIVSPAYFASITIVMVMILKKKKNQLIWSHCSKQFIVFPLSFCGGVAQLALWFLAHPSVSLCIPAFLPFIHTSCPCFCFKCLPDDHRSRARHRSNSQTNCSTSSHNCIKVPFPMSHLVVLWTLADAAQNVSQNSGWLTDSVLQLPVRSLVWPGVDPLSLVLC